MDSDRRQDAKAWVSADVKALVHYILAAWAAVGKEAAKVRVVDAAKDMMAQEQRGGNAEYELADARAWVSSASAAELLLLLAAGECSSIPSPPRPLLLLLHRLSSGSLTQTPTCPQ